MSSSYDEIVEQLRTAQLLFRQFVCEKLQEPLNAKLQTMPHNTYEEKQEMAVWLNHELRSFEVAVKCPKTGIASALHTDPGRNYRVGQFRMRPIEEPSRRTYSSVDFFPITLMPRPASKRTYAMWLDRFTQEGKSNERNREHP